MKNLFFAMIATLLLAGCATTEQVEALQNRVSALENQIGSANDAAGDAASAASRAASDAAAAQSTGFRRPAAPGSSAPLKPDRNPGQCCTDLVDATPVHTGVAFFCGIDNQRNEFGSLVFAI